MKSHLSVILIVLLAGCLSQKPPSSEPQDWMYQTDGSILTPPVLKDGRLYVYSLDGYLYCFDAMNGDLKWRVDIGSSLMVNLILGNNSVFISYYHQLYEEDPMTGKSWEYELLSFDMKTGKEKWRRTLDKDIEAVVASDDVYVATDKNLMKMKGESGTILWKIDLAGPAYHRQLNYFKGRIFIETESNTIVCFSDNGEKLWEIKEENESFIHSLPKILFSDDTLLISMNRIYKVNILTGEILWHLGSPGDYFFNPLIVNGSLYSSLREDDGMYNLVCIDLITGGIIWRKPLPDMYHSVLGIHPGKYDIFQYKNEEDDLDPLMLPQKAVIIRALDGELLLEYNEPIIAFTGNADRIILSTEGGLVCDSFKTGERLWEYSDDLYLFLNILIEGERAIISSDNGKIYGFAVNADFPFRKMKKKADITNELGKISQMTVNYRFSACFGGYDGNFRIALVDNSYRLVSGSEDECSDFSSSRDFKKKIIPDEIMTDFLNSITDLYIGPRFDVVSSTSNAHISIEVELDNGETIMLTSGSDTSSLLPWEINFRDCQIYQLSGKITLAFYQLMDELEWCHKGKSSLGFSKMIYSGLSQPPLTLLEICKSPKRKVRVV